MNKVRLYYIKHQGESELEKIGRRRTARWLSLLSEQKQKAIQRLLHYPNRVTSLLGLQLLALCARDEGVSNFKLRDVQYPDKGKPYWQHDNECYDFNVSHSGDFILAIASTTVKVGVDVEAIRKLKYLNFKMVMSAHELLEIKQTPLRFFDLWSKKEAVVKAANTVGLARMRDVNLSENIAMLDEDRWFIKNIELHNQYAINLATSKVVDELIIKKISLEEI